ncbi:ATP-dependent RNA helicase DbpA [Salinispirillum sp. LH 10-3-1]|uniref:ATP-dependent RNA helicase DbpA n=1 Tax=Salinispirillum sp. LH 10-3-1 TaxID=2952525 RepID=A0AB38YHB1_9GAMM
MPSHFRDFSLPAELVQVLDDLGFTQPTAIQSAAIPVALAGQDVKAKAPTGSGKTTAFGVPLVSLLTADLKRGQQREVQALVMCPTRELAEQVAGVLRQLARWQPNSKVLTLCGGAPVGPQLGSLEHGADIVVGTPGRLLMHLRKGSLDIKGVKTLVLDEADRMLDMGFMDDIRTVRKALPAKHQTLLFSATYVPEIEQFCQEVLRNPAEVAVAMAESPTDIEEIWLLAGRDLPVGLIQALQRWPREQAIVFCNTKAECGEVVQALRDEGYSAAAIQGDMMQRDREKVLASFAHGSLQLLIATDVAARGLDIPALPLVINYDLPRDTTAYTHRIGRTGRAGATGLAVSILPTADSRRAQVIMEERPQAPELVPMDTSIRAVRPEKPEFITLELDQGKKAKLRPGDILGALTGTAGLSGDHIGKITLFPMYSLVAVQRSQARKAEDALKTHGVKKMKVKVRPLRLP